MLDLTPNQLAKAKISFSFIHGRKFHIGSKNVSLNEIIRAVTKEALKTGRNKKEWDEWDRAFAKSVEKGYKKDYQSKKNFCAYLLAKIKHIFSKRTRKRLLNQFHKALSRQAAPPISTRISVGQAMATAGTSSQVKAKFELENGRNKFTEWFKKEPRDLSLQGFDVYHPLYDQASTQIKGLSQQLPQREMILHSAYFRWGFSLHYGVIPGEQTWVPLSEDDYNILSDQSSQKIWAEIKKQEKRDTWWPIKHPQTNDFFSPKLTGNIGTSLPYDTTADYLVSLVNDAYSGNEKSAEALKMLEMLFTYHALDVKKNLDEATYQKLRGLIPVYPDHIPEKIPSFPKLPIPLGLDEERNKLIEWVQKEENKMGEGGDYSLVATKGKVLAQNLPKEEMKLHFFPSAHGGCQFFCGEILGRVKLIPLTWSEGQILFYQKKKETEGTWFPIKDPQTNQFFSPQVTKFIGHPLGRAIETTAMRLEGLLARARQGHALSLRILEAFLPYASSIKNELDKISPAAYQELRTFIPAYRVVEGDRGEELGA